MKEATVFDGPPRSIAASASASQLCFLDSVCSAAVVDLLPLLQNDRTTGVGPRLQERHC